MLEPVREWLVREIEATFPGVDAAAVADLTMTPGPVEVPIGTAQNAALLVALCRVVRGIPGAREWVEERYGTAPLSTRHACGSIWAGLNERYAVPAPDVFDPNWPDHKVARVVDVPEGSLAGDELLLGNGEGGRFVIALHPAPSGLLPMRGSAYDMPFAAWEVQATAEAEAILRRAHGEEWLAGEAVGRSGAPRPIRRARPGDVPAILSLIRELALYERSPDSVVATEDGLRSALFGGWPPPVGCYVAEVEGEVVGFALWFFNFSTWLGRHGIYLEDLYVRPAHRGAGLGRALLDRLVRDARESGYGRLEWVVLDWNEPAHVFYRAMGAEPMDDWTVWRLVP